MLHHGLWRLLIPQAPFRYVNPQEESPFAEQDLKFDGVSRRAPNCESSNSQKNPVTVVLSFDSFLLEQTQVFH